MGTPSLQLQALTQGIPSPQGFYAYNQGDRPPHRGGKPYKPFITRGRGRPSFSSNFNGNRRYKGNYAYRGQRGAFKGNHRGRQGQKFDKSPTTKKSKVNSKTPNKDYKDRCYTCHEYGHISPNCPQNPRARHRQGNQNQYNQAICQNIPQLNYQQGMQPCAQTNCNDDVDLTNAYSEAYAELEQFESVDTLNAFAEISNEMYRSEKVDTLNN